MSRMVEAESPALPPDLVWRIYSDLAQQCQHFNQLESGYRTLASTWLLAAFGGIGLVLKDHVGGAPTLLIAGIAAAGGLGVALLWILDCLVYHSLLAATFTEQLKLESHHSWLPPVAHNMMAAHNGTGVSPKVVWFYIGGYLLMIGISSVALGVSFSHLPLLARLAIAAGALALAGFPMTRLMRRTALRRTGETASFRNRSS